MSLQKTTGVPLPLQGGSWQATTNVLRERQRGNSWCWAACLTMVLKAFKNYKEQCEVAKSVWQDPCTPQDDVRPGRDIGYPVADLEELWKKNEVPAESHPTPVQWTDIEHEVKHSSPGRPVEIFLGTGESADSKDGHLVLIIGAEETVSTGRAVVVADPVATDTGLSPKSFASLEAELGYGKWDRTWTNLFWKRP